MLFLLSQFKSSSHKGSSLQIYTDSMTLVDIATKNKGGVFNVNPMVEDVPWFNLVNEHKIKISYAMREYLKEADALAKQGNDTGESTIIWC